MSWKAFKNELAILDLKQCGIQRRMHLESHRTLARELWIELYHVGWSVPYTSVM